MGMNNIDVTNIILDHIINPSRFEIECLSLEVSLSDLPIFSSLSIPSINLNKITPIIAQQRAASMADNPGNSSPNACNGIGYAENQGNYR